MSENNLHYLNGPDTTLQQDSRLPGLNETPFQSFNGHWMAVTGFLVISLALYSFFNPPQIATAVIISLRIVLVLSGMLLLCGLYVLHPKQATLLLLFGAYRGTDRAEGLRWANPFYRIRKVSLRAHTFISEPIKVNDKRGNPIEIAAAVVWRVRDTTKTVFDVENYQEYVQIQSEAAIRYLASSYAYDDADQTPNGKPGITLRSGIPEVAVTLSQALQERFNLAGILVVDAKLTHLAYAPEIAGVMLRRQQAEAIIAARQKIVTGAVTMVEMALQALSEREVVTLDDERKAAMVSNLMVVLCAEKDVQPIVNTGSLYS